MSVIVVIHVEVEDEVEVEDGVRVDVKIFGMVSCW